MARRKKAASPTPSGLPAAYAELLESLKSRVRQAQTKAMLSVHQELIQLYWDIGRLIVEHVQKFLLELGAGFAFVGRQVPISVGDDDDYLDLLFYHLKLRCFVVIDLKMKKFTPADAGQMNYYLSAVDSLMKHSTDAPSIGVETIGLNMKKDQSSHSMPASSNRCKSRPKREPEYVHLR